MKFTVYLAGEIHSNWREELIKTVAEKNLPFEFVSPQTEHDLSDDIGAKILGEQPGKIYHDRAASDINNFRTDVLMQKADIVIALFGDKFRQWNTAMDASTAINLNKPLIIIRPEELIHPLKELSNKAHVVVETIQQAVKILEYIYQ